MDFYVDFNDRKRTAVVRPGTRPPKPRPGAPLIAALVDRSGSMQACRAEMERGLNAFVRDQAAGADVMLYEFDHVMTEVWPMQPIESAPRYQLEPRGGTSLYDSLGEFMAIVGDELAEEDVYRPVCVVVVTDGEDTTSKEWTYQSVADQIAYWRDGYRWQFIFLGANVDAVATAASMGIPEQTALTFDVRSAKATYAALSATVSDWRAAKPAGFTEQDRRKALGQ